MKFNIETRDGKSLIGPPSIGDVYSIRGGRGLRYGHKFVIVSINDSSHMAYALTVDGNGDIVGVYSVGVHILEDMVPIARVDGMEQLKFTIRTLP